MVILAERAVKKRTRMLAIAVFAAAVGCPDCEMREITGMPAVAIVIFCDLNITLKYCSPRDDTVVIIYIAPAV